MSRSALASLLTAVLALWLGGSRAHAAADANPVTLVASDGVKVYGWVASTGDKGKPIILLFHQAGSNHAEYDPIAPELVRAGFNTLALDQRSGSERWGQPNRTAKELGHSATYNDAYKDLQAAVTWAKASGYTGKIIVWGSSYSSSLVFLLAAERMGVDPKDCLVFEDGKSGMDAAKAAGMDAVFIARGLGRR
jgi:alpha-beta hydrolase superfamily lysophospholipase